MKRIKLSEAPPNALVIRIDAWAGETFVTGPVNGAWYCYGAQGKEWVDYHDYATPPFTDYGAHYEVVVIGQAAEAPTYTGSNGGTVVDALLAQESFTLAPGSLSSAAPTMPIVVTAKINATLMRRKAPAAVTSAPRAGLTEGRASLWYDPITGSVFVYTGHEKRCWRVIGALSSTPGTATWRDDAHPQGRPTYRGKNDESAGLTLLIEAADTISEVRTIDRPHLDARQMVRSVRALPVKHGAGIDSLPEDAAAKTLLRALVPEPQEVIAKIEPKIEPRKVIAFRDAPPNALFVRDDNGAVFVTAPASNAREGHGWCCFYGNGSEWTPVTDIAKGPDWVGWPEVYGVVVGHATEAPTYTARNGGAVVDTLVLHRTFKMTGSLEPTKMHDTVRERIKKLLPTRVDPEGDTMTPAATVHERTKGSLWWSKSTQKVTYVDLCGSAWHYGPGDREFRLFMSVGSPLDADAQHILTAPIASTPPLDQYKPLEMIRLIATSDGVTRSMNTAGMVDSGVPAEIRTALIRTGYSVYVAHVPPGTVCRIGGRDWYLRTSAGWVVFADGLPDSISKPAHPLGTADAFVLATNVEQRATLALTLATSPDDLSTLFRDRPALSAAVAAARAIGVTGGKAIELNEAPSNAIVVSLSGGDVYATGPMGRTRTWYCAGTHGEWIDAERRKAPEWVEPHSKLQVVVIGRTPDAPVYTGSNGHPVLRAIAESKTFKLQVPLDSVKMPPAVHSLIRAAMSASKQPAKPTHPLRVIPAGEKLPEHPLCWTGEYLFWTDGSSRACVIAKRQIGDTIVWESGRSPAATRSEADAIVLATSTEDGALDSAKRIPLRFDNVAMQRDLVAAGIPDEIRAELLEASIYYEVGLLPAGTVAVHSGRAYYVRSNGRIWRFSSDSPLASLSGSEVAEDVHMAARPIAIGCQVPTLTDRLVDTIATGRMLDGFTGPLADAVQAARPPSTSAKTVAVDGSVLNHVISYAPPSAGWSASPVWTITTDTTSTPASERQWLVLHDGGLTLTDKTGIYGTYWYVGDHKLGISEVVRAMTMPDRIEAARRLPAVTERADLRVRLGDLSKAPDGTAVILGGDALLVRHSSGWCAVADASGTALKARAIDAPPVDEKVSVVRYGSTTDPFSCATMRKLAVENGVDVFLRPGALFVEGGRLIVQVGFGPNGRPSFRIDPGDDAFPDGKGWGRNNLDFQPVFVPNATIASSIKFEARKSPLREVIARCGLETIRRALAGVNLDADVRDRLTKTFNELDVEETTTAPPERAEETMANVPIGTILFFAGMRAPLVVVAAGNLAAFPRFDGEPCAPGDAISLPPLPSTTSYELYRPVPPPSDLFGVRALHYMLMRMGQYEARKIMNLADHLAKTNPGYAPSRDVLRDHCRALYVDHPDFADYEPFDEPAGALVRANAGEAVVAALSLGAQMAAAKTASDVVHAGAMRLAGPVAGAPIVRLATPIALRFALDHVPADALPVDKRHVEKGVELAIAAQAYETARDVVAALLPMFAKLAGLAEKAGASDVIDVLDADDITDHGFDIPDLPTGAVEVIDIVEVRRD